MEDWKEEFEKKFNLNGSFKVVGDGVVLEHEGKPEETFVMIRGSKKNLFDFIHSVEQRARERAAQIVEKNKLPVPNPYGSTVKVENVNKRILDKIKGEILSQKDN